jgi:hypothetical protein
MRFTEYPSRTWQEILPGIQSEERDLVSKLVVYQSTNRLTADEVCRIHTEYIRLHCILIESTGIATPLLQRDVMARRGAETETISAEWIACIVLFFMILGSSSSHVHMPPHRFQVLQGSDRRTKETGPVTICKLCTPAVHLLPNNLGRESLAASLDKLHRHFALA